MSEPVFLLDGEVTQVDFEDDSFLVRVISTGEEHRLRRPYQVKWRKGRFVVVWQASNGQYLALPLREESE